MLNTIEANQRCDVVISVAVGDESGAFKSTTLVLGIEVLKVNFLIIEWFFN